MANLLPAGAWDEFDDLVPPCPIEKAVVKSVMVTSDMVRSYLGHQQHVNADKCVECVVDDKVYINLLMKQLQIRYPLADLSSLAPSVVSVCKELVGYDRSVVSAFFDHYVLRGTSGMEEVAVPVGDETHFYFLLYMLDIKSGILGAMRK